MWGVVNSYFEECGFIPHHIDSYNKFVSTDLINALENKCIEKEYKDDNIYIKTKCTIKSVIIKEPSFIERDGSSHETYPTECVWRSHTYASRVFINIDVMNINSNTNEAYAYAYKKYLENNKDAVHSDDDETVSPIEYRIEYAKNNGVFINKTIHFFDIPVMVMSNLCNLKRLFLEGGKQAVAEKNENIYEIGGYFIIDGSKKVLVSQEIASCNRINAFANNRNGPKYNLYTEIKSSCRDSSHTTTTRVGWFDSTRTISVVVPYLPDTNPVPLTILFKALYNIESYTKSPREEFLFINNLITKNPQIHKLLMFTYEEGQKYNINTHEEALMFIATKAKSFPSNTPHKEILNYANHILNKEFIPHLGTTPEDRLKKIYFLGTMVQKLMYVHKDISLVELEDRDHYANKRVLTSGEIFRTQFANSIFKLVHNTQLKIEKCIKNNTKIDIVDFFRNSFITNIFHSAVKKNSWEVRGTMNAGISQTYENYNYMEAISVLRKVSTPMSEESTKITEPRKIHPTQLFLICISSTPEGKKVGCIKDLALLSHITIGEKDDYIREIINDCREVVFFKDMDLSNFDWDLYTKVMINGDWVCVCEDPESLKNSLISLRRRGLINKEISISYKPKSKTLKIMTDSGRMCRPLIIVKDGKSMLTKDVIRKIKTKKMKWSDLFAGGIIELLDKDEEDNKFIAMFPEQLDKTKGYTHCEIHPALMFGVNGGIIPFSNHTQSPRNTYQISMGKQAIGIPRYNYVVSPEGCTVLHYPQIPLCMTQQSKCINFHKSPSGQNVCLAITPWQGYGQEDSIILNKESVDLGLFDATKFYTLFEYVKPEDGEEFGFPSSDICNTYKGNTSLINKDGIPKKGAKVKAGDIVIGKIVKNPLDKHTQVCGKTKKYFDKSIVWEHVWGGIIHKVQVGTNSNGYKYVKVIVAQYRKMIEGDKCASICGQKGTCGKIAKAIDLPFIMKTGQAPDMIFNPLALPSRMTINQLIIAIIGKQVCTSKALNEVYVDELFDPSDPIISDATPFEVSPYKSTEKMETVYKELKKHGFSMHGKERMIDGMTGKQIPTLIFNGVVYYQRLRHMIIDKIHARARGPRAALTHQPREGRKENGGSKIGVMERDNMLSQGAASVICDRMFEQSDKFEMWVCGKGCGNVVPVDTHGDKKECTVCGTNDIQLVDIPYGTKLVNQYLMGMHINPRIICT